MTADPTSATTGDQDRRAAVLESALTTFARFGYRKTSMEEIARAADISRPGLYFLFASKESLFRAAVTQALEQDIAAIEQILAAPGRPLSRRIVEAFDRWAGRYVGPLTRDVAVLIEDNPTLLGAVVETTPRRFEELVTAAIAADSPPESATRITQTLISTSIGIKHQTDTRAAYLERLEIAVELLLL
ncbi:TetR/AcrR family transcriptional regulator [Kribbella sp. NPDC056861]|uniref:TetR/AcrR family transcriptional regulator n=1 Tax=Kribbella sp. NPDC056861 TaxID=3154857 RepID=UPI00342BE790